MIYYSTNSPCFILSYVNKFVSSIIRILNIPKQIITDNIIIITSGIDNINIINLINIILLILFPKRLINQFLYKKIDCRWA